MSIRWPRLRVVWALATLSHSWAQCVQGQQLPTFERESKSLFLVPTLHVGRWGCSGLAGKPAKRTGVGLGGAGPICCTRACYRAHSNRKNVMSMDGNTIVAHTRSISGVDPACACELFLLPDSDCIFSAHASEDGTIFVTQINVRYIS